MRTAAAAAAAVVVVVVVDVWLDSRPVLKEKAFHTVRWVKSRKQI